VLITSLSIQYDQVQWDLNPEGIGVQPMLANVTLGIVFQGGSSLGGPIQRLQNAVSFNYYANQEVYDDRADSAVYKNGTLSDESYIWIPGRGGSSIGEVRRMFEPKSYEVKTDEIETVQKTTEEMNENASADGAAATQALVRKGGQETIESQE
jgi:hypothetical protein